MRSHRLLFGIPSSPQSHVRILATPRLANGGSHWVGMGLHPRFNWSIQDRHNWHFASSSVVANKRTIYGRLFTLPILAGLVPTYVNSSYTHAHVRSLLSLVNTFVYRPYWDQRCHLRSNLLKMEDVSGGLLLTIWNLSIPHIHHTPSPHRLQPHRLMDDIYQ